MKNILIRFLVAVSLFLQVVPACAQLACSYTTCVPRIPFVSSDSFQEYGVLVQAVQSGTGVGGACSYTTCVPQISFRSTDEFQKYGVLVALLDKISGGGLAGSGPVYDVTKFGLVADGVTDNAAALNTLLNTTAPAGSTIYFPTTATGGTYNVSSAITVTDKYFNFIGTFSSIHVTGNFTAFKFASSSNTGLLGAKNNFNDLIFTGTATGTAQGAVYFYQDASEFNVSNCRFYNFGGAAVATYIVNSASGAGGNIANCYFFNDAIGIDGQLAGEYVNVYGCYFVGCTQAIQSIAGNWIVSGNNINRGGAGIKWSAGSNDGHGIISNNNINHMAGYGVSVSGLVNGMTISDNHSYSCNWSIATSTGVVVSGGELDVSTFTFNANSGLVFNNVTFVGTLGGQVLTGNSPTYVNCRSLSGALMTCPAASCVVNSQSGATWSFPGLRNLSGSNLPAVYLSTLTPSPTNYMLTYDGTHNYVNAESGASIFLQNGGTNVARIGAGFAFFTPSVINGGAITPFIFTAPNNTGQTASSQVNGFVFNGASRQWAAGNLAANPEFLINPPVYSAVAASTFTDVYAFRVSGNPGAGANMTLVRPWAGSFNGNVEVTGKMFLGNNATAPTAYLHTAPGTAGAGSAPIKLSGGTLLTTPESGAVEFSSSVFYVTPSSTRYQIATALTASSVLDFPSTITLSSSDLTLTVTGAAVGDAVSVGLPAAPNVSSCFTAFVSSVNTVTVRFNNYSSSPIDPASATYKAVVLKN